MGNNCCEVEHDEDECDAERQLRDEYKYTDADFDDMVEEGVSSQDALDYRRGKDALDELYGKD